MKPGSLIVAYLHGGEVAHSFHHSCRNLWTHDLLNEQRLGGFVAQECGAGRITDGRNDAVSAFLRHDAEWLAFVDSDMGFDPDTFDRLIAAADPVERPIVGALAFGQRRGSIGPAASVRMQQFPTIYRWVDGDGVAGCAPVYDYPQDTLVECDATGAACFVVHRSVLLRLAETFPAPRPWFDETIIRGRVFGEDLTFFRRCRELGYPVYVHTGVKTSHYKPVYLTDESQPLLADIPTYVVVPMRDRMDLTRSLLEQLAEQDEHTEILVFDNGSSVETKRELAELDLPRVRVVDAEGWTIHQMWNAGLVEANRLAYPCNVAILNNDLKLGPRFLSGLARELRRDPLLAAVSPNYDGRAGEGVQYVREICADRYDGTGGLAGFAFMLRGEAGYRFPEQLQWWYGDNHMLASIRYAGSEAGIVLGTTCEHIGGGSQTGRWEDPELAPVLDADRQWFTQWMRQCSGTPETHVFVLWSGCREQDRIRANIAARFTVLDVRERGWGAEFVERLGAFYSDPAAARQKAASCGSGTFTVLVVRDDRPVYAERDTTRGRRVVNANLYDAKQQYRSWSGNPETVHASDTAEEAQDNLVHLVDPFDSVEDAVAAIPCPHLVLRNFDGEDTADVDLLVADRAAAVAALGAVKLQPEPHRVAYAVRVADRWVPFDVRSVGDGYYCQEWQKEMLQLRVPVGAGPLYRPSDEDWYWSLLYHALHHKGTLDGYRSTLDRLRPGAEHTQRALSDWMAHHGYDYVHPVDESVPLIGIVSGAVTAGFGAGARDVAAGWYGDVLPYVPYAGTLNVAVTGRVSLPGPGVQLATPDGRQLMLWPARVRGVDCHLMVGGDGRNTVELLAPVRLRDELVLADGDKLTVEVMGVDRGGE